MDNDQVLLNSTQVAHMLGISMRTLWRMVAAGTFPKPIRFNRKLVRWKTDEVKQYLDELKA